MSHHASWLSPIFDKGQLKIHAQKIADEINKDKLALGIDAIAITGISGSIVGGLLSYLTDLPLIIVRKSDDTHTHSSYCVEYNDDDDKETLNYVIVDDLISKGSTINRIVEMIDIEIKYRKCELVKIYLYRDYNGRFDPGYTYPIKKQVPVFAMYDENID